MGCVSRRHTDSTSSDAAVPVPVGTQEEFVEAVVPYVSHSVHVPSYLLWLVDLSIWITGTSC